MKCWAVALTALAAWQVHAQPQNRETSAEALRKLQRRADTCPSDKPVSCKSVDSQLPGNFCCGSGTTCQSVDRSSSAICCPSDGDCGTIAIINCDLALMDASKHTGPIYTTKLSGKLPTCGDKCCPFGYTCGEDGGSPVCKLNKDDAGPATTTKVTTTASATATSSSTAAAKASGIDSKNPPPEKKSSFSAGAFFAGFFPGILVGVLATLAWVVLTKRNKKPADTRGLNTQGHGRPYISAPMQDTRQSNERTDFLGRTRSRARSMFSVHQRSRTVDSSEIWGGPKIPTPPPNANIPVNYINDMPDVPVTPARRVARHHSDDDIARSANDWEKADFSPVSPEVSDPNRPETIRIYSPEMSQQQNNAPPMPQMPTAAIPPLRGMNTQRRVSPDYGSALPPQRPRRDSGTAMGTFGSPFQTPEKKPTIANNNTPSMYATYHDVATAGAQVEPVPQTLTPARYDPNADKLAPSAAATLAASRLSEAQRNLPSQRQDKPVIPPRPQARQQNHRPETQYSEFDFDHGIDHEPESPRMQSPPREAYKSQAVANPYAPKVNPNSTFDNMIPQAQFEKSNKDKHATNATTFTTMLRNVGIPDPGNQLGGGVPQVPKLDLSKVKGNGKGKGMI